MDNPKNAGDSVDDLERGCWALVHGYKKSYIGMLQDGVDEPTGYSVKALQKMEPVVLDPAFEYDIQTMAVPVLENGRPVAGHDGQPAIRIQRMPLVSYPDFCNHQVSVTVKPSSFMFLDDMQEGDRATYKMFVRQAIQQAEMTRIQRAGIVPAGPKDLTLLRGGKTRRDT
jgi:hypothetical protein